MSEKRKQKELISVRVTTKFKQQLENIAEEKGMTLPDLVRYILTNFIEKNNTSSLIDSGLIDINLSNNDIIKKLEEFKEKCRKSGIKID